MELRLNIKAIIIGSLLLVLMATSIIFISIIKHQNRAIKDMNEAIRQERVDNIVMQAADSIKFRQLQLKSFADSMALAKEYRDKELELVKQLTQKQLKKYENIIKVLPNSTLQYRDSIWKSEFAKPEQIIK